MSRTRQHGSEFAERGSGDKFRVRVRFEHVRRFVPTDASQVTQTTDSIGGIGAVGSRT